jgi:hypothetical protein
MIGQKFESTERNANSRHDEQEVPVGPQQAGGQG